MRQLFKLHNFESGTTTEKCDKHSVRLLGRWLSISSLELASSNDDKGGTKLIESTTAMAFERDAMDGGSGGWIERIIFSAFNACDGIV